jgi:hypothetical protein
LVTEPEWLNYENVISALQRLIGRRVHVQVESADPILSLARVVGVLTAGHPQRDQRGREEGIVFTVEAGPDRHPPSDFRIWRHASGTGVARGEGVAWRVGVAALIVDPLDEAYGFPRVDGTS